MCDLIESSQPPPKPHHTDWATEAQRAGFGVWLANLALNLPAGLSPGSWDHGPRALRTRGSLWP